MIGVFGVVCLVIAAWCFVWAWRLRRGAWPGPAPAPQCALSGPQWSWRTEVHIDIRPLEESLAVASQALADGDALLAADAVAQAQETVTSWVSLR